MAFDRPIKTHQIHQFENSAKFQPIRFDKRDATLSSILGSKQSVKMDIEHIKFEIKKELLLSIKGKITGDHSRPLKVGDLVRVRPTVIKPSTKWGNKGVSHASIGRINEIKGRELII